MYTRLGWSLNRKGTKNKLSTRTADQQFLYVPKAALITSIVIHISLPIFFIVIKILEVQGIHILPIDPPKIQEPAEELIQVDVVALPDLTAQELKNIDPTLPVSKDAKAPTPATPSESELEESAAEEMILTKQKAAERAKLKQKNREERLEKIKNAAKAKDLQKQKATALANLEKEAARAKALEALSESRPALAGNIASEGTSTSGVIGGSKDKYIAILTQTIRKNFNVFAWQKSKNLSNLVVLEITPEGLLRSVKITQPSGDRVFDSAVIRAIRAIKAFPIPEDLTIIADGIEVEFRP